jgi:hypothetical protein
MQAIQTKYHGPTNTRGSRLTAKCDAGRVVVSYNHSMNGQQNHRAAAIALAAKLDWDGDWQGGQLPDGSYAWTRADDWPVMLFTVPTTPTDSIEEARR